MNLRDIFFIVLALAWMSAFEASSGIANRPGAAERRKRQTGESREVHVRADEQVGRADLTVRADVTKNEVTLSGMVESEAVRSRAIELAKTAHVGVLVNDKMTVMPRR